MKYTMQDFQDWVDRGTISLPDEMSNTVCTNCGHTFGQHSDMNCLYPYKTLFFTGGYDFNSLQYWPIQKILKVLRELLDKIA